MAKNTDVLTVTKAKGGFVVNVAGEVYVAMDTDGVKAIIDEAFADAEEEKKEK